MEFHDFFRFSTTGYTVFSFVLVLHVCIFKVALKTNDFTTGNISGTDCIVIKPTLEFLAQNLMRLLLKITIST